MGVDWRAGIVQGNPTNALLQGFGAGQDMRKQVVTRNALSDYVANPSVENGNALVVESPQLAGQAQGFVTDREGNQRASEYRTALAAYSTAALGTPESESAYQAMLRADAPAAQTFRHNQYGEIKAKADAADQAYDFAVERLANVTDDASYQRVLAEVEARFKPMGIDIRGLVPPTYPGPEGVQALLRSASDAKGQLAAQLGQLRLDWDIQDDKLDNARADRDTDSQIAYRNGRLDIARHPPVRPRAPAAPRPPRAPSPSSVKGAIMEKYRRGEPLTANEQAILDGSAEGRGSRRPGGQRGLPTFKTPEAVDQAKREGRVRSGDRFRMPNGDIGTVD